MKNFNYLVKNYLMLTKIINKKGFLKGTIHLICLIYKLSQFYSPIVF